VAIKKIMKSDSSQADVEKEVCISQHVKHSSVVKTLTVAETPLAVSSFYF
jgi:hypothetical protein